MEKSEEERQRGRRPMDPRVRRAKVIQALDELKSLGVPFTMTDVADRSGVSRATLYRDAALRDLIGTQGDGPSARPVDSRVVKKLEEELQAIKKERRSLRTEIIDAKQRVGRLTDRCALLEREQDSAAASARKSEAERLRQEAYAEGFAAGTRLSNSSGRSGALQQQNNTNAMALAAARLPRSAVVQARRVLARALHPDLFASDPAAAVLATEILKQLNGLAEK
jgi:AcrR family transcriptional regulator